MIVNSIYNKVVVDTGPLYEFLLLRFIDRTGFESFKKYLSYVTSDAEKQDVLKDCFLRFHNILTTPGVISEINAHIGKESKGPKLKTYSKEFKNFWAQTIEYFIEKNVQEEIIRLIEQNQILTVNHGPVDTSIIDLALRQSAIVFTSDMKLYSEYYKTKQPEIKWLILNQQGEILEQ